ncbi:lipoprotein A [Candidatus Nitrosoglobus terrae]|uniref:Endolytic peptidoglycan transglycosylase RlpA n=1 Tax=Candidatus Nitrosoglobus terrae TaxID=1630141 RepID=A0A1Q2SLE8_9GAMM|nr:septal ring lytic transglycosylase RlpA family protein [Candidatus Nitrosoglobus terrae]BAW79929.1 lipoprotein A [Candidatus Nitrosoglobus terrae]
MKPIISVPILSFLALFNTSCTPNSKDSISLTEPPSKYGNPPSYEVNGKRYYTLRNCQGYKETGIASWYGSEFQGRRTSSGEIYDMHAMTAAHRSLPLPCYVMVTNLNNGRQVIVRINDRGPFKSNRIIDLSYAAAEKLYLVKAGTGLVEVRAVEPKDISNQKNISLKKDLYIQVASFQNRSNAEQLQKQLQSMVDTAVKINPVSRQLVSFYQVRIGPLSNAENLDSLTKHLAGIGFSDYMIIH